MLYQNLQNYCVCFLDWEVAIIYKNEVCPCIFLADTEGVQFTANQGLTSKLTVLFNFQLKNNQLVQKRELKN